MKPVKPAKKGAVPTRDGASSVDKLVARARVDEGVPSALICIDFSSLAAQTDPLEFGPSSVASIWRVAPRRPPYSSSS